MFESLDVGELILQILLKLLGAAVILVIGRGLAGLSRRWLNRSLEKAGLTPSLISLLVTLLYYGILLLAVMVALAVLGVPTTAIVGAAGLVVVVLAIALQQSLGNLAATVNFLLFKPFEVGDVVETSGTLGVVSEIQMFSTVLDSPDNKTHVLPNAKIQGAGLTNYSKKGSVRLDLSFRISYESDIEQAKQILEDILTSDSRVLTEPFPLVFVQKLAESHVELVAWPFVPISNFLSFQKEIAERVKQGFDEVGVVIPRPQQEVHLINVQA
jgi:small conductance mechanosensitive channel